MLVKGLRQRAPRNSPKMLPEPWKYQHFAKKKLLWLQREGRSHHAAAATATLFSQNRLKPMKYLYILARNHVLLIKAMENQHFGLRFDVFKL